MRKSIFELSILLQSCNELQCYSKMMLLRAGNGGHVSDSGHSNCPMFKTQLLLSLKILTKHSVKHFFNYCVVFFFTNYVCNHENRVGLQLCGNIHFSDCVNQKCSLIQFSKLRSLMTNIFWHSELFFYCWIFFYISEFVVHFFKFVQKWWTNAIEF